MKALILCTVNSCRSKMAQGFLQSLDKNIEVCSAGTIQASRDNSRADKVMAEVGIYISKNTPTSVNEFLDDQWDYLITVCDDANETSLVFLRKVKHRLHMGFEDPSNITGSEGFIMNQFHKVRDHIKDEFDKLYTKKIKPVVK